MSNIEFKYDLGNVVNTPICLGVVTKQCMGPGGVEYFIESATQGIESKWWHERFLSDPPPPPEDLEGSGTSKQ
jgi:hypothetical protein